ncbi:MAG TPA: hypothetical protein DIT25_03060 [Candidatus Moranbacteria bacterium]|nr:hypothetical protein [Candidatus Moranbacteria bacterium]
MQSLIIASDTLNFLMALAAVVVSIILVLRTERGLDKAAKYFLGVSVVLAVSGFIIMNKYLNIISIDSAMLVLSISRIFAITFFILGICTLVRICNGKCN